MAAPQLSALLTAATRELAAAGVPSPRHDAEELAALALGIDRKRLHAVTTLGDDQLAAFRTWVTRRAARVPLQHLTGRAYFRHLTLAVGPGVFVPRPETELVAQAAIDEASGLSSPLVVDLCTGSGAIALAVAQEVPAARVGAVELDPGAYAWALRNCAGSRVDLREGDAAAAFADLDGAVDVVVSNPPYIPVGSVPLDPEVREHDPSLALWSGEDGLDMVRVVERAARRLLRPGGLVVIEHADAQGESVPAVFDVAGGWAQVRDCADLAGRPRFTTARREAP